MHGVLPSRLTACSALQRRRHCRARREKLLVFSPAFVADCLETLIEIGEEYQEIFEEHGEAVELVPSLNDDPS